MKTKTTPHRISIPIRHLPAPSGHQRDIAGNSDVQPQPAASTPPPSGLRSAAAAASSQHRERAQVRREARRRAAPHAETQPRARRGKPRRAGAGGRARRGPPRLIRFVELIWANLELVSRAVRQVGAARVHRTLMRVRTGAPHRSALEEARASLSALLSLHRARAARSASGARSPRQVAAPHASQALRGVRCSNPEQPPSVRGVGRQRRKH